MTVSFAAEPPQRHRLPDFLIVGAARAGTTSMYEYLGHHPEVFMPSCKEPHFLAFADAAPRYTRPLSTFVLTLPEYEALFQPARKGQICGEASAAYLYFHEQTIAGIRRYIPRPQEMNIIIILRNPVLRAYSMYSLLSMYGFETLSFQDALQAIDERIRGGWEHGFDYLGFGMYYEQVKAYLDAFQKVKIILFDDLVKEPNRVVKETFTFLGVEPLDLPQTGKQHNAVGKPRFQRLHEFIIRPGAISSLLPFVKLIPLDFRDRFMKRFMHMNLTKQLPGLSAETHNELIEYYRRDVQLLQDLIGRDLSAWLQMKT